MSANQEQSESRLPSLTLFVTGNAPRSQRARKNLAAALRRLDVESIEPLEVDLLTHPKQSITHSVFATPALLKTSGEGEVAIIYGDLSDEGKLLDFLNDL